MAKPLSYNATLVERIDTTDALAIFKVRPDEPLPGDPPAVSAVSQAAARRLRSVASAGPR